MSSNPASALLAPDPPLALSPQEAQERSRLRESLRLRRSVDHFARAWYGGIAALILTGLTAKLSIDDPLPGWGVAVVAVTALAGWCFSVLNFVRSRRAASVEHEMLARLEGLDARAPAPPELF